MGVRCCRAPQTEMDRRGLNTVDVTDNSNQQSSTYSLAGSNYSMPPNDPPRYSTIRWQGGEIQQSEGAGV